MWRFISIDIINKASAIEGDACMCGRYAFFSDKSKLLSQFHVKDNGCLTPSYNIGPGQSIVALLPNDNGSVYPRISYLHWGLQTSWGPAKTSVIINARSETLHLKPLFKKAFKQQRCIIVADGWYEWHLETDGKQPYYFCRRDEQLLAFAGLWFEREQGNACVIVTRRAPIELNAIHPRCPFLLAQDQVNTWLSGCAFSFISEASISRFNVSTIHYYPVSMQVNHVRNQGTQCIEPIRKKNQSK